MSEWLLVKVVLATIGLCAVGSWILHWRRGTAGATDSTRHTTGALERIQRRQVAAAIIGTISILALVPARPLLLGRVRHFELYFLGIAVVALAVFVIGEAQKFMVHYGKRMNR